MPQIIYRNNDQPSPILNNGLINNN
jgi:hypothetical protein